MKAILLLRKLLPATLLAIGLAGCGGGDKPADKNSTAQGVNPGGDGADKSKPTTVELAAFIKGKRVWILEPEDMGGGESAEPSEPDPDASSPEPKANESSPDKSGDECEVPAKKAEGPPSDEADEMFIQFNEDGTIQVGRRNQEGKAVARPTGGKITYVVKSLEVIVSEDGKQEAALTFSSNEPKAGDEISITEKDGDKITTKITKIEPATKLEVINFDGDDPATGDAAGDDAPDDAPGESPEKK